MDKKITGICAGLLLMLLILAPPFCFSGEADQEVELVYSGLHFLIPGGMTAIGTDKAPSNFIGFRYGKKFLGFSKHDSAKTTRQACSETELLWSLIRDAGNPHVRKLCDHDAQQFKKLMLADSLDHGIWKTRDFPAYFIIAKAMSHVFLFRGTEILQIDSNFMDATSLKHVLAKYMAASGEDDAFPPGDLIAANIQSTDLTAAVKIMGVKQEKVIRADDGTAGYFIFRLAARTLIVYKGKIKDGDSISYGILMEAGIKPPATGEKYIVSLRKKDKEFILPDGGYGFEYSRKLDGMYKKAAGNGKD